jgi:hypothetical protein
MGDRRAHRGPAGRTDAQILASGDMALLAAVAAGRVSRQSGGLNAPYLLAIDSLRMDLRRLAREELVYAPISGSPTLQPRGERLLLVARGELPAPIED